jgi:predicted RNA-binding protein Jag
MDNLEISARTVEEATQKALTHLNAGLDEIEITVLNEGKADVSEDGDDEAKISVRFRNGGHIKDSNVIQEAQQILQVLLEKMGVQATVNIETPVTALDEEGEVNPVILNIVGGDLGV